MRINEPSPPHSPNKRQVSQAMLSLKTTGRNSVSARLSNEFSDLKFENQVSTGGVVVQDDSPAGGGSDEPLEPPLDPPQ